MRTGGDPPVERVVAASVLAEAVAAEVAAVRHRHHNTGVVAPQSRHAEVAAALAGAGLHATDRVHDLAHGEVPLFTPEAVKGLEFDGVVVVNPHEILDGTARGARLLYVAMTRAVQVLHLVGDAPLADLTSRSCAGPSRRHLRSGVARVAPVTSPAVA